MNDNIISVNVANFVTITIMATLGMCIANWAIKTLSKASGHPGAMGTTA